MRTAEEKAPAERKSPDRRGPASPEESEDGGTKASGLSFDNGVLLSAL